MRTKIYTHIKNAIAAADGEITITMTQLALVVGASIPTTTKHVKSLADLGHITTVRQGISGSVIRLGSGTPAPNASDSPEPTPTESEAPHAETTDTAWQGECEDDQPATDAPAPAAPETPQSLRAAIHAHL